MSAKTQRKLLRAARGKGLQRYRDRAAITLASIGVPLNSITKIKAGDVMRIGKRYFVVLSTGRQIRISQGLGKTLLRYIQMIGGNTNTQALLFRSLSANGQSITSTSLCVSDLIGIIQGYAIRARVLDRDSFF